MKRALIVVVLFAAVIGVWLKVFQGGGSSNKPKTQPTEKEKKLITLNPSKRDLSEEQKKIAHEDDPNGPLTLSGQVIGVDGKFAPGATVSIDSHPPRVTVTDERGWFFFEGMLGRPYYIEAKKENAFVGPLLVNLESITDPVELRLKSGSILEVLVLDEETTRPVPNIKVVVSTIIESSAVTGADGVARFLGVGVNYANMYVDAPGYSQIRTEFNINGVPDQVQREIIYAKPGSPVSGVVIDPNGNPVAGAKVLATTISNDYTFLRDGDSAETDVEGKFMISAVPPGGYRLYAAHPKFRAALSEAFDVEEKIPSSGHSIQLQMGGSLSGRVVDQDDKPVSFTRVTLYYEQLTMDSTEYWDYKKSSREVFCDEKGTFSFDGVAPGKIELRASAEETTETVLKVSLAENESKTDILLLLDPGEQISGRVVSDKGEPIEGAEIYASKKTEPSKEEEFVPDAIYPRSVIATADTNGEFILRGLEPGEYFLSAAMPYTTDKANTYREEIAPGSEMKTYVSGSTGVTLVMKKLDVASIRGNVVFEEGGVPSSFAVRVGTNEKYVKDNSSFLIEGVIVEYAYSISIDGDEFLPTQKLLTMKPNEELDLGTIKVKRGRTIEGQVVNARNSPIAGAQINFYPTTYEDMAEYKAGDWMPGYSSKTARSDQDGRFVIEGASSKTEFKISATHPHKGTSKEETIAAGTTKASVTLTMRDGGILTGVVSRDGKPCRANITLLSASDVPEDPSTMTYIPSSISGGDGVYRMERIPEGKYEVEFYRYTEEFASMSPLLKKTVTIKDGETVTLDADLPVLPALYVEVNTTQTKDYWWFQLFKGTHNVKTNGDLEALISKLYEEHPEGVSGLYYYGNEDYFKPGIQAKFIDLPPQSYTLCLGFSPAVYVEEDPEEYTKKKINCQPVKVSAAPELQSISVNP
jgi:uncharacterized GH25 family protein